MDLWMPDVRVAKIAPRLMDKTGRFSSPLSGNIRTVTRPGDRWAFQLDYMNLQGLDRARLESLIANQRGAANRVLYSPGDYVQRGSFPSTELLSNNAFTNGTTGWSALFGSLSVIDRAARLSVTAVNGANSPQFFQTIAGLTQYAPYVLRSMILDGPQSNGLSIGPNIQDSVLVNSNYSASRGLASVVLVAVSSAAASEYPAVIGTVQGYTAGAYITVPWCSLSRCALVDNAPNLLLQSDTPGGTSWILNNATAAANGTPGPDGSNAAFYLAETTANASHNTSQTGITVSTAVADYSFSVYVKSINRAWCYLQIVEQTGSSNVTAYFNTVTGALGSTPSTGANWANLRTVAEDCGNGWFRFTITARKTNAATALNVVLGAATADNTSSYTGVTTPVPLVSWRASLAQSSVPTRAVQTLTAATPGVAQTGNALYLKGLPANGSGSLLPGDWIEVNKELKRVTSALNSNSSGLGYLQFSPPLRNSPLDNDPVIVNMPMGRFIFSASENGWSAVPPYFANSTLDLVEAL